MRTLITISMMILPLWANAGPRSDDIDHSAMWKSLPEVDKEIDKDYDKVNDVRVELFTAFSQRFGKQYRVVAILSACGKEDLAGSIEPSDDEVMHFAADRLIEAAGRPGPAGETLRAHNLAMVVHLMKITYFDQQTYRMGFQEAVMMLKNPDVCAAAEKMAAEQLAKKRGKIENKP